eukprot:9670486-Alexandrium_andersonii.AAC.1
MWENRVEYYQRVSGLRVEEEVKKAILLRFAPSELQAQLQFQADHIPANDALRSHVLAFARSKKVWTPSGMDD